MILSFRSSAGSWLGVLAYRRPCNHASQCGFIGAARCSSVTADLCGPEVSSAAAAASQSSQSATCQLCERSSVVRYEQNRVQYEQNRVVYKIEAQGRVYPVCS